MKQMRKLVTPQTLQRAGAVLLTAVFGLAGCESAAPAGHHERRASRVGSSPGRIFNPQTRDFEWVSPDGPPTSPGADRTRRQPFY